MAWFQLIQIIAIVAGWIIVHKFSVARDRDKARREMIAKTVDGLVDEISKLLSIATTYHTELRNPSKENELKVALQDMTGRVALFSDISSDIAELAAIRTSIVGLRKAMTGKHFEDEHNSQLVQNSEQMQLIAEASLMVKRKLTKLKYCQFSLR